MESQEHELILPIIKEDNICLPLSINAVSKYWNIDLPMSEAIDISKKYQNVNGSILIEGIELAERHGLASMIIHSSINELKKIIDMGIPPIVILPGVQNTIQHASVISGYDETEKTIMHYIPEADNDEEFKVGIIPEKQFDKIWSEDGRLMIILAPSDIMMNIPVSNEKSIKSNRLCFLSEKLNLLKNTSEAIESLKNAINLDEKNSTAYSLLGSIYNEQNSPDCVNYYKKSIDINNRSFLAYRGLGNYFLKTQNYSEAEKYYSNALDINSTRYGPIYKNRAIARMQQNKNKQAKSDLENYLKH
ncbi:MAG: C39 family peptidase, partial [Nitrosopumilaceae archaeon]|nr:C39 family peptidase [Nitrosopumilaceae archaeon]